MRLLAVEDDPVNPQPIVGVIQATDGKEVLDHPKFMTGITLSSARMSI